MYGTGRGVKLGARRGWRAQVAGFPAREQVHMLSKLDMFKWPTWVLLAVSRGDELHAGSDPCEQRLMRLGPLAAFRYKLCYNKQLAGAVHPGIAAREVTRVTPRRNSQEGTAPQPIC